MDLKKALGGADNMLLLIVGGVALVYVATGANAWAEEKWGRGAGAASGAAGLLKGGKLVGKREGFEEGYNTFNPSLHIDEVIRYRGPGRGMVDNIATGVTAGVTTAVVNQGVDYAMSRLPQWPGSDPEPAPPLQLQQQAPDPREPSPPRTTGPRLPADWWIDDQGRFRDENNRVASDDRRKESLKRERRQ
jgi:hypothetical protein